MRFWAVGFSAVDIFAARRVTVRTTGVIYQAVAKLIP